MNNSSTFWAILFVLFGMTCMGCAVERAVKGPNERGEVNGEQEMARELKALEKECSKVKILHLVDMGVHNGYFIPAAVDTLVSQVAKEQTVVEVITKLYITADEQFHAHTPITFVFVLLDILLRVDETGRDTNEQRASLWSVWNKTFPMEMGIFYRGSLSFYEQDIVFHTGVCP